MTTSTIQSVNLLPISLQTDRNAKFLASTLDQLIQPAQLDRLDGYIGSTLTNTYNSKKDIYISDGSALRKNYQLAPALILNDSLGTIKEAQGYDDLINEISIKGGNVDNLDRIFRTSTQVLDPHVDWDKLVNYQNYYWLPQGPSLIECTDENIDPDTSIIGLESASITVGTKQISLTNGMMITFGGINVPGKYYNTQFYVEGVGDSIVLVDYSNLNISANTSSQYVSYAQAYVDKFDSKPFDNYDFDANERLPIAAEYITINRASRNLNPWTRYNRWVHKDVIAASAVANDITAVYPIQSRAQRPIVEFVADLQLYNYGTDAVERVDVIDTTTKLALRSIQGSTSTCYIDGVPLEEGHRIIFNADTDPDVVGKIYSVKFITVNGYQTLTLDKATDFHPVKNNTVSILNGSKYAGSSWWYDGNAWIFAQQKTKLNQAPLFDLYDNNGHSYSDKEYYLSNFSGNKIFGYKVGTGVNDKYLGFPISYRNINAIGSFLFYNHLTSDTINISVPVSPTFIIKTNIAYCKVAKKTGDVFENAWIPGVERSIPLINNEYYEEPLSLTNNPLNGDIAEFTISELSDHIKTIESNYNFESAPLRDSPLAKYHGTRLISSSNPISFSQMFIGKKENSVIDAIVKVSDQYNQFKLQFLTNLSNVSNQLDPINSVDNILKKINLNKTAQSPYYLSDMAAYGENKISRKWTVTDSRNTVYPLNSEFDLGVLSTRSVLVYLNNNQLINKIDYEFDTASGTVKINTVLSVNDVLIVNDYVDTTGVYIPPTPSKLGLYPKFVPSIYIDNTYATPTTVIQGHDGSIIVAFNDYRDNIILELEKRIYNNIKSSYRRELFDINSVTPGAFRDNQYSQYETIEILVKDFTRWAGQYGIDYSTNSTIDPSESKTWNYTGGLEKLNSTNISGSWRALFKYFYDTDRPHTHPWEMLGYSEKPTWWKTRYGTSYSSRNSLLWNDLAAGYDFGTKSNNIFYARPRLPLIIPVDGSGNLLDPITSNMIDSGSVHRIQQAWAIGDIGPAESAWRRSSYWPFAVQRLLALTKPADYASYMYDPSRMNKNIAGQWTYGDSLEFLQLKNAKVFEQNNILTNGYSVLVAETGKQRTTNYLAELQENLTYADYRLFFKVGGFVDPDTLQIIIDAYEPTTNSPGAILPTENYKLKLNVSNPIKSVSVSGLIIQKSEGNFIIKGYDALSPYFTYYKSIRNSNTQAFTVGGRSEAFVTWEPSGTIGNTGLSSFDTTTANSAIAGNFYQKGQIVRYGNNFYRVTVAHRAEATFNSSLYQSIPSLPTVGGVSVQLATQFETTETQVPYGVTLSTPQEVYDLIMGYSEWLQTQGFIFDEYNKDLGTVIDWTLTAKEFLFWSSQNWADGSIITLSPFANQLKYQHSHSVVNNIFDNFYQYGILRADGTPYPQKNLSISRYNGICTVSTLPDTDGIYFARLNCVQKEHAIIFDNKTIFGDIIYDIQTGNRQRRMKLVGFRTANWNGDYFSPGFIYDEAKVVIWAPNTSYKAGSTVSFSGNYYTAPRTIDASSKFNFSQWNILNKKPVSGLLPNFDYKINQFEDFYSLDIDNFDAGQEKMAQHLTGYTPRVYLNNIFTDPIAQYKFYQGYIKDKGTFNAINKLAKASMQTLNGEVGYKEEWAFRVGHYGAFKSYQELELPLVEGTFLENPQIINFVDTPPGNASDTLIHYSVPADLQIVPDEYITSSTFSSTSSVDSMILTHSGYVRIDDVTATAYNENSLLDIANNSELTEGNTIWLGFKSNGEWDVYRYTYNDAGVVGVYVSAPVSSITFTTNIAHGLSNGQLVSISKFNQQVDGIYIIIDIPRPNQFTVSSTLASIEDAELIAPGQLYTFNSARISDFDSLPDDKELYRLPNGTKFWIDGPGNNTWAVYEKIDNYNSYAINERKASGFGSSISKRKGNEILVAGAPAYYRESQYGAVLVFQPISGTLTNTIKYSLGDISQINQPTRFGSTVVYDDNKFVNSNYGMIFAGAPGAYNNSGTVKISTIDSVIVDEGASIFITNTSTTINNFGTSIYVQRSTSTKLMLIGAPGTSTTVGAVYAYSVSNQYNPIQVNWKGDLTNRVNLIGSEWGHSISGSEDATKIAISAPGYSTSTGVVVVFSGTTYLQTLNSPIDDSTARFGDSVLVSPTGSYLFVSAPYAINKNNSIGQVAVYSNVAGLYVLSQIIENPIPLIGGEGMKFGISMDVNTATDTLIISSQGVNKLFHTIFDNDTTLFDNNVTRFIGTETNSGTVFEFYRKNNRFVLSQELTDKQNSTDSGTNYGASVLLDDDSIFVGAPAFSNPDILPLVYNFTRINKKYNSWNQIRKFDNLVDTKSIKRISLIDTNKDDVIQYLDVIDPLKGKISGIAEQELTYKLISDPAVYSIGVAGVNVDTTINWLDDHVGKLWWDLSNAKFLWYEQSDLEYRRNYWGKLFPGATIDVYEWVGSTLLPSEWSTKADTPSGLTTGISGQPKFADNSVMSVKQIYDTVTNSFTNVYYYWVKNKVTVPNAKNRRRSSFEVSSIIADPTAYGLEYASVISSNAIALSNISSYLVNDSVNLNVAQDVTDSSELMLRHTEWLLLKENSEISMPSPLLEKKLIDSIVGHDKSGNLVPDPELSDRTKYGIGIRPQQTLFKDRLEVLRNIVEFANTVLINEQITGNYSFVNLKAQEEIPSQYTNTYDQIVEDNDALTEIDTSLFEQSILTVNVDTITGKALSVNIDNSGYGYGNLTPVYDTLSGMLLGYQGPVFESYTGNNTGNGLEISTIVDSNGAVLSVDISNAGYGYTESFQLRSRVQSVIIQSDLTYNGSWTKFNFDYETLKWVRKHTQEYNTNLYWKYVDWKSADFNPYLDYTTTLQSPYQLAELKLEPGQYVKVTNSGNGRYIVVKSLATGTQGTYGIGFDLVYSENGTIQILDSIWNLAKSYYGWDYVNTYDNTLWDQTPDIELQYIITALKEDIFVGDLKINWNLLFFKAVKYALSEQKLLDWAFKTSFINVVNNAGSLGQPPVYKLQDSAYYENYISEVKPYHTHIRTFTTDYSILEPSNTSLTDFDYPVYWDSPSGSFISPDISTDEIINNPTRKNNTTIKFDRISKNNQIGSLVTEDTFVWNGYDRNFVLNWVAQPDKSKIKIRIDGVLILSNDYTVHYYTDQFNGYDKEFSKVELFEETLFSSTAISTGSVITVSYNKNSKLLNAVERIENYYTATTTMLGKDSKQLMYGLEYPGLVVGGQYEGYRFNNTNGGVPLDTSINSAGWSASGIDPTELTLDGEFGFVTPNTSYAPEEVVPGHIIDSVGINVYTKTSNGAPRVYNGRHDVVVSPLNQSISLIKIPSSIGSIIVTLDNKLHRGQTLQNVNNFNLLDYKSYGINWATGEIILGPQTVPGVLGYTIVETGGGSGKNAGVIDKQFVITNNATTATVVSLAAFDTVNDAYVTLNGQVVPLASSTTNYGYILEPYNKGNNRASVKLYNIPNQTNYIQAWFFAEKQDKFNTIHEQIFNLTGATYSLSLQYPTGQIEPLSGQTIVEITDDTFNPGVEVTRRLLPPDVNYYSVSDLVNPVFPIVLTQTAPYVIESGLINWVGNNTVRVYKNGIGLTAGFDYEVSKVNMTVSINTGSVSLSKGDAIAIETFPPTIVGTSNPLLPSQPYTYQYRIDGQRLYFAPGIQGNNRSIQSDLMPTKGRVKVVTYDNTDGLLIQNQRFESNIDGRYKLSRPVFDSNYVWVTVFKSSQGIPNYFESQTLINGVDFIILDDSMTVQLSDNWVFSVSDIVNKRIILEISSFGSQQFSSTVLGYRIFNDMLGKTHYSRLSSKNSTRLTRPLKFTDTEIYVDNANVLTYPIIEKNIPGIITVSGERIEFFKVEGNILKQLRRSTLGTGPEFYLEVGTTVIDQGSVQDIPFTDNTHVQNTLTNVSTNTYTISKLSSRVFNTMTSAHMVSDGITLSSDTTAPRIDYYAKNEIKSSIRFVDQVDVFYGGKKLNKDGYYLHDTTISYDSIPISSIVGYVPTIEELSSTPSTLGEAYHVLDTNKVWVYTGSRSESNNTDGYVFTGITFIEPDFTITDTQNLVLNTDNVNVQNNKLLTIVKKDFAAKDVWNDTITTNTTVSLLYSTGTVAHFLQQAPADLPDMYYYGGSIGITDEGNTPLTDNSGQDIQGFN